MRRRHFLKCRSCFAVLLGLLCLGTAAYPQMASVTTKLLGRIDSKRVAPGSPFFVTAISDWKSGRCRIRAGDTLEGRVVAVEHHDSKPRQEQIELRFLPLTCAGDETQVIEPILVALQSPQLRSDDSMLNRAALTAVFAAIIGASHTPSTKGTSPPPAVQVSRGGAGTSPQTPTPQTALHTAEVRGFPGVALSLPTLTTDPTNISAPREMIFDPETRFILVIQHVANHNPAMNMAAAPAPPPSAAPAAPKAAAPLPPAEEVTEVEKCVDTGCALAETPPLRTDGQLERQLSLRSLGYRIRGNRVLRSLAEDAAVRFLGDDQLLVTFNAHPLIHRSQEDASRLGDPRIIRALLISVNTGKVLRAEDWHIAQEGAYLWPLDNGRVLAHVGNTLVVYGPNLIVEKQWTLPGTLAFLRVAPSRHLVVAVVVHERHTPEQHRRLAEFLGPDRTVEEDYDLTLLDGQLNVVGTKHMDAEPELTEVLDSGLVLSESRTRQRWQVQEMSWDGKQRGIAQVVSSCPLRIETLPTDLILLVGCSGDASHSWYKVIRKDGKTLLTGATASNDWLEDADALTASGVFAIGIVEASRPVDFSGGMLASEFEKVAVSVYSSTNGRRLYATQSSAGAVNRQSFALSGSGDRLAILSGEDVSLYKIGDTSRSARTVHAQR